MPNLVINIHCAPDARPHSSDHYAFGMFHHTHGGPSKSTGRREYALPIFAAYEIARIIGPSFDNRRGAPFVVYGNINTGDGFDWPALSASTLGVLCVNASTHEHHLEQIITAAAEMPARIRPTVAILRQPADVNVDGGLWLTVDGSATVRAQLRASGIESAIFASVAAHQNRMNHALRYLTTTVERYRDEIGFDEFDEYEESEQHEIGRELNDAIAFAMKVSEANDLV